MKPGPLGILGGTFNPIHRGHIQSALELCERLALKEMRLMPSAVPPHRELPTCSAARRAQMVRLAAAEHTCLQCDDRELQRSGPSYTIDSLADIRAEEGTERSIILVMGADAVAALDGWHRWRELTGFSHILVIARPGWQLPREGIVADWLQQHLTRSLETLQHTSCGAVLVQELTPHNVSSTEIRRLIAAAESPRELVPEPVWQYIKKQGLYGHHAEHLE